MPAKLLCTEKENKLQVLFVFIALSILTDLKLNTHLKVFLCDLKKKTDNLFDWFAIYTVHII